MANRKELLLDGYAIEIVKHSRAKSVRIRLQPHKPVRVTIPLRSAFSLGEHFLKDRLPWIKENLPILEANAPQKIFGWNYTMPYLGGSIRFVKRGAEVDENPKASGDVCLLLPSKFDFSNEENHKLVERLLVETLRELAKNYLPNRLQELAMRKGFEYKKLTLKNLKSRWGSCSSVNNINLNIHLMRLPSQIIDYVIMHELQHTTIKNHSQQFWHSLEVKWPGSNALDKELNKYRIAWF
jgi:predicted metal-dependent hydrolase